MFCSKCGRMSTYDTNIKHRYAAKPNEKCLSCRKGRMIDTQINRDEAFKIAFEKSLEIYGESLGDLSSSEYDELYRKLFYYGKFDQDADESKFTKARMHEETVINKIKGITSENVPKCPVCGSTNLSKITATRKILKVGLFGRLGTGDLGKTYQCGDCGVKF